MNFSIESIYNWYRNAIRNPKYRWWVIGLSALYLVSPFDLLPDVFPIIGWIDDGVIATLLVAEVSQLLLSRLKDNKSSNPTDPAQTTASTPPTAAATSRTVEVDAVSMD